MTRQIDGGEPSPLAPTRVERKRSRRIEEILTAAAELLGDRGYDSVSLDDVADRLDVTKGLLYHYFASKDELVTAAIETLGREWTTRMENLAGTLDGPPAVRLRALLTAQAHMVVSDHPAAIRLFMLQRDWPEPQRGRIKELRRRHNAVFAAIMDDGIRAGDFIVTDPDITLQCIHSAINQAPLWTRQMPMAEVDKTLGVLIDTLMKLVGEAPVKRARQRADRARVSPAAGRGTARR